MVEYVLVQTAALATLLSLDLIVKKQIFVIQTLVKVEDHVSQDHPELILVDVNLVLVARTVMTWMSALTITLAIMEELVPMPLELTTVNVLPVFWGPTVIFNLMTAILITV